MLKINKTIGYFAKKVGLIFQSKFGDRVVSMCMFGSVVKGRIRKGSDIDFLLVFEDLPMSYHKRVKIIMSVIDEIRNTEEYNEIDKYGFWLEPSFILFTKKEIKSHPSILLDIAFEGKIIFDKRDFLKKELKKIKNKLEELGAKKEMTSKGYYWVLKTN